MPLLLLVATNRNVIVRNLLCKIGAFRKLVKLDSKVGQHQADPDDGANASDPCSERILSFVVEADWLAKKVHFADSFGLVRD